MRKSAALGRPLLSAASDLTNERDQRSLVVHSRDVAGLSAGMTRGIFSHGTKMERKIMRKLFNDETGFIISAELVLVLTIAVLGTVVGLTAVRDSIAAELVDLSDAFGAANQTFNVVGISKPKPLGKPHAAVAGFGFADNVDVCDCIGLTLTDVCGKPDSSVGAANEGNL